MYENEIITCCECGCVIEGETVEIDGFVWCEDCAKRNGYIQCDDCGEWIPEDEAIAYDGLVLCESCRDDRDLVLCDNCGEWTDEYTYVNGGWRQPDTYLCDDCLTELERRGRVFHCDNCEEWYDTRGNDYTVLNDGDILCDTCRDRVDVGYCEGCGEYFRGDELRWSDNDDCYYCEDCYPEHDSRYIRDHYYKPELIFYGLPNRSQDPKFGDPLTFGFELEVDCGHNEHGCAEEINDAFGSDTLYMKDDSSVDFEIVTHPRTLESYMDTFDFEKLCAIPPRYGFKSHDAGTCGFHIHVGRDQLAEYSSDERDVIAKITLLMYRHRDALAAFSRRTDGALRQWARLPELRFYPRIRYDEYTLSKMVENYYCGASRYQALNTTNRGTIEFRLWRGSLMPDTLRATIALTSNIVRYAMNHTFEDVCSSTFENLLDEENNEYLERYVSALMAKKPEAFSDSAVREIPYNKEPATTGTDELELGDYVEITSASTPGGLVSREALGAHGTVVREHTNAVGQREYLLSLDWEITPERFRSFAHSGDMSGDLRSTRYYWVRACDVTVRGHTEFYPGVRVMMGRDSGLPAGHTGTVGTVSLVNHYSDIPATDEYFSFGIIVDDFSSGHSLSGFLSNTDGRGWYVPSSDLCRGYQLF